MNWIVKNESKHEPGESFEDRMARMSLEVEQMSDEQIAEIVTNREDYWAKGQHDLVQAARIAQRTRSNTVGGTDYDGIWT